MKRKGETMKKAVVGIFALGIIAIAALGFAGNTGKKAAPAEPVTSTVAPVENGKQRVEKQLLFFLNPNGRPCQMQDAILDEMAQQLAPLATVSHIQTTVREDHKKFSDYGIRGLPTIVILDKTGKETGRYTGIQNKAAILAALKKE